MGGGLEAIMRFKDGLIDGEVELYGDHQKGIIEKRKYELGKLIYKTHIPRKEMLQKNSSDKKETN